MEIPEHVLALELMREMRGKVLALGEDAYKGVSARCKVGDTVLISKFSGVIVRGPLDGKTYRLCNDQDIFCRIHGDMSKMFLKDPITHSKQTGGEAASRAKILQARP